MCSTGSPAGTLCADFQLNQTFTYQVVFCYKDAEKRVNAMTRDGGAVCSSLQETGYGLALICAFAEQTEEAADIERFVSPRVCLQTDRWTDRYRGVWRVK